MVTGSIRCSIKIINACPSGMVNNTIRNEVIPINTFLFFSFIFSSFFLCDIKLQIKFFFMQLFFLGIRPYNFSRNKSRCFFPNTCALFGAEGAFFDFRVRKRTNLCTITTNLSKIILIYYLLCLYSLINQEKVLFLTPIFNSYYCKT